jgi:hypothetical protein
MSASVRLAIVARPHRLAWPRTLPFQGSNTGSNPVGDTTFFVGQTTGKLLTIRHPPIHDPATGSSVQK